MSLFSKDFVRVCAEVRWGDKGKLGCVCLQIGFCWVFVLRAEAARFGGVRAFAGACRRVFGGESSFACSFRRFLCQQKTLEELKQQRGEWALKQRDTKRANAALSCCGVRRQ